MSAGHTDQWFTRFASAGEGIQLRYGSHAGRLISQYAVANSSTTSLMAVSVYSDDHGVTWKPGAPTEGNADENKVVSSSPTGAFFSTLLRRGLRASASRQSPMTADRPGVRSATTGI